MKRLLQLRHWQLFLISWGPLTIFFALLLIRPTVIGETLLVWVILFPIVLMNSFAWVWSIVKVLSPTISPDDRPNSKLFKICFWVPAVYAFYIVGFLYFSFFVRKVQSLNAELELKVHIGLTIVSVMCIAYGLLFIAKTVRTAELRRNLTVFEYSPDFVLMVFAPIGLWIIQPRLNRLVR